VSNQASSPGIKNASKYFGGLTALDNVSLNIYPCEVVALLGADACGALAVTVKGPAEGAYPLERVQGFIKLKEEQRR
jgi:ABC-type sugar transport system ATPase subunit